MRLRNFISRVARIVGMVPPSQVIVMTCMWKVGMNPKAAAAWLRRRKA